MRDALDMMEDEPANRNQLDTELSFFAGKRPWSRIKDRILGTYMVPYLRKVSHLGKTILLIDCFAGPGSFEDGTDGSPLIMCKAADRNARSKYLAVFVNNEATYHAKLQLALSEYISTGTALPVFGDAKELLSSIGGAATDSTIFAYLDPFGLKGCDFDLIATLLSRGSELSTELLINISMPTLHRLAAAKAVERGNEDEKHIKWRHELLTRVLGGEDWKGIMFQKDLTSAQKESLVIEGYKKLLNKYLPFAGSCPVQANKEARVKYFITFCSRHPHAQTLMNDIMLNSYNEYMHLMDIQENIPLFADVTPDWRIQHFERVKVDLKEQVLLTIRKEPGHMRSRVWELIVSQHFMRFTEPEFKMVVQELYEENLIDTPTEKKTKRLNEECVLIPK
jgi:three-Cys-motif partner protein